MEISIDTTTVVILCALLFISIGWIAPALYTSHAPQERFIEVHSFTADNTTVDAESQDIHFNRTVRSGTTGTVITQLYLIDDDGERIEVNTDSSERYFKNGQVDVERPMELPDNLVAGEYKYVLVIEMQLTQGRVVRKFVFVSDSFYVEEPNNSTERFK